jgi:peptidoglycan LD-endopeptidase CwlK
MQDTIVIASKMTREQALAGVRADCSLEVLARQKVVEVKYYSFDGRLHQGQVVVDELLVPDIEELFTFLRTQNFPVASVIPISAAQFRSSAGIWDDYLSMEANNSSSFNYREIIGSAERGLSLHALGLAFDINPRTNPVYGFNFDGVLEVYPKGEECHSAVVPREQVLGALWQFHPVVNFLVERGWCWGGAWSLERDGIVDLHHFEKIPKNYPASLKRLLAPVTQESWS